MELNLCMGCMREKTQPGSCPHCGFDEHAYEPSPHHLPPQTILAGKYLVGRVLGEGGFGITYLGWDLNLEMKVAIKECFPNGFVTRDCRYTNTITMMTGSRAEFYQKSLNKFVDEARRLGKFWRLPGIVAVRDYFQENKTAYIVMEFAEGETLKALLKKQPGGRLQAEKVFEMLRPVMDSLGEIHSAGLIHRDISPDNLMVDNKGQVKLLDFGAARDFMTDGERSLSVMLKPGYAPEEQYRSRGNQGPWTDVYALCATMYRAVTGQVPPESLDRMSEDILKRPSELGITIESAQEAALLKGMSVLAGDRYQSMGELAKALSKTGETEAEEKQEEKAEAEGKNEENVQEKNEDLTKKTTDTETVSSEKKTEEPDKAEAADDMSGSDENMDSPEIIFQSEKKNKRKKGIIIGYAAVSVIAAIWLNVLMAGVPGIVRIGVIDRIVPSKFMLQSEIVLVLLVAAWNIPFLMTAVRKDGNGKLKRMKISCRTLETAVSCLMFVIWFMITYFYSQEISFPPEAGFRLYLKTVGFMWAACLALLLWTISSAVRGKNKELGKKMNTWAAGIVLISWVYDFSRQLGTYFPAEYIFFYRLTESICFLVIFGGHIVIGYYLFYKKMPGSGSERKDIAVNKISEKSYKKIRLSSVLCTVFGFLEIFFIKTVIMKWVSDVGYNPYSSNLGLFMVCVLTLSMLVFTVQIYRNSGLNSIWKRRFKITEIALSIGVFIFSADLTAAQYLAVVTGMSTMSVINGACIWPCRIGAAIWLILILVWFCSKKIDEKVFFCYKALALAAEIELLAGLFMIFITHGGIFALITEAFFNRMILAGHIAVSYLLIREDCSQRRIPEKN